MHRRRGCQSLSHFISRSRGDGSDETRHRLRATVLQSPWRIGRHVRTWRIVDRRDGDIEIGGRTDIASTAIVTQLHHHRRTAIGVGGGREAQIACRGVDAWGARKQCRIAVTHYLEIQGLAATIAIGNGGGPNLIHRRRILQHGDVTARGEGGWRVDCCDRDHAGDGCTHGTFQINSIDQHVAGRGRRIGGSIVVAQTPKDGLIVRQWRVTDDAQGPSTRCVRRDQAGTRGIGEQGLLRTIRHARHHGIRALQLCRVDIDD